MGGAAGAGGPAAWAVGKPATSLATLSAKRAKVPVVASWALPKPAACVCKAAMLSVISAWAVRRWSVVAVTALNLSSRTRRRRSWSSVMPVAELAPVVVAGEAATGVPTDLGGGRQPHRQEFSIVL